MAKTQRNLRVCMVAYSYYESDNRVMRYAESLAKRGDQVDVISLRSEKVEKNEIINLVNITRIQSRRRNEKTQLTYLVRLLLFQLKASWLIWRRHRKQPYDLIHVHSVPDFLVFTAWLPKRMGAKVILDIHDVLPEFYASKFRCGHKSFAFRLLLGVEKISTRVADHVIIANDLWRERLVSRSVEDAKCTSILNFPDETIFRLIEEPQNQERFVLMYPGSMNWHQGLDLAILALNAIRHEAPHAELHIYGDGPEKENLKRLVASLGLTDIVFIRDGMPIRKIADIMRRANLGIVPKRSNAFGNEAFSTKTLEFMLLGVPLVVADTAVDRYYYDETMVRFFQSGDVDSLAAAILEMISDANLRNKIRNNGLNFAKRNCWSNHKKTYFNIVNKLMELESDGDLMENMSISNPT